MQESPAQFLKNFNQMSEDFRMAQQVFRETRSKDSSKLTLLKKFPIPGYYENMEGLVIEIDEKKNVKEVVKKFDLKDEEFRKKHEKFVKKALKGMIENNEKHIEVLDRNRGYYEMQNGGGERKRRSESVEQKIEKNNERKKQKSVQQFQTIYPYLSSKAIDKQKNKEPYILDFHLKNKEVIKLPKSLQPNKLRNQKDINNILLKRKGTSHRIQSHLQNYLTLPSIPLFQQPITRPLYRRKQSLISLVSSKTNNPPVIRRKQSLISISTPPPQQDISIFFNPSKYIKSRFSTPLTIPLQSKTQQKAKNLRNQIIYHYLLDKKQ